MSIRYTHDPIKDLAHASEILEKLLIPQYVLNIMVVGRACKVQRLNFWVGAD
jgi:hypothetical protein